jgi:hypothetical protein
VAGGDVTTRQRRQGMVSSRFLLLPLGARVKLSPRGEVDHQVDPPFF